jgi:hypothetical protein
VRRALKLEAGDRVLFRLSEDRAIFQVEGTEHGAVSVELEKAPDIFALAGSVPVPPGVDPADWSTQREAAWSANSRSEG